MNEPASTSPRAPRVRRLVTVTLLATLALPLTACGPLATDSAPATPAAGATAPSTTAVDARLLGLGVLPAAGETADPPAGAAGTTAVPALTTSTTAPAPAPVPPSGPVAITADGLGVARFGQEQVTATGAINARLGAPTLGMLGNGYGRCGVKANRDVRWGDLTVSFTDTGSGMRLSGWYWGADIWRRNATGAHSAPTEVIQTLVANPWDLVPGQVVRDSDELLARVRATHPDARSMRLPGLADPTVSTPLPDGRYLHIVLHPVGDEGFLVESIWALTPGEVVC